MLGVNEDGVYLSANMLQVLGATGGPNFTPVVVIPKSDLLQPVPSVINATALSTDPSRACRVPAFSLLLDPSMVAAMQSTPMKEHAVFS